MRSDRLLADSNARRDMAVLARERALHDHSWDARVCDFVGWLQSSIHDRRTYRRSKRRVTAVAPSRHDAAAIRPEGDRGAQACTARYTDSEVSILVDRS